MQNQFSRTELLLGQEAIAKLRNSHVAIFGLGGVGGYVMEALARSGVGALDLIDNDVITPSNLNRQILATHSTIGQAKVEVAAARIADINPNCKVAKHQTFYLPENQNQFDFSLYDYIVDAIDTIAGKISLVEEAAKANVPIISAMGAGNKLNPAMFEVADIYQTSVCPLAHVMRKELRKRGIKKLKVVYSKEQPLTPITDHANIEESSKRSTPGSVSFTPPVVGLIMAGEVIKDLITSPSDNC